MADTVEKVLRGEHAEFLRAGEHAKPSPLRTPFEHCLEIRARPLRFEPSGFGRFAHAEITVDQASAPMALGWYARGPKRIGVGLTLVSQRIKPRRANDRRSEASKAFCTQR